MQSLMVKSVSNISPKLLIIDDDHRNRKLLEVIFKSENYNISQAEDGLIALEKIKLFTPDLILLDIMMPKLDGMKVLQELKRSAEFKDIPIIFISALNDQETINKGLALGVNDYITKPFYNKEVKLRVRNALKNKKVRDELQENNKLLKSIDLLTRLPNKTTVKKIFGELQQHSDFVGILIIQLDHIKRVTLGIGPTVADKITVAASNRIKNFLQDKHCLGYLSGGKFIILQANASSNNLKQLNSGISSIFNNPICVSNQEYYVKVSVGAAISFKNSINFEQTLIHSEVALNSAEKFKEHSYQFFSNELNCNYKKDLFIGNSLHNAIKNNELELHYLPIIDTNTKDILGAETLIRWNKENNFMLPNEFMHLVAATGLLQDFHYWVISEVICNINSWNKLTRSFYLSINISPLLFYSDKLFEFIIEQFIYNLKNKNINIVLEITEECMIQDIDKAIDIINKLSKYNISIHLDDFGTGYSSFAYLKELPIKAIKVDKLFVDSIPNNNDACNIIKSIADLAAKMNLDVIAEGVENEQQLDYLRSINCNKCQGFLFYRPLSAKKFINIYKQKYNQ